MCCAPASRSSTAATPDDSRDDRLGPWKGRGGARARAHLRHRSRRVLRLRQRDEEVPVLEAVGHPVAIAPQPDLRAEAKARDWTVLDQISRPQQPAAVTVARTAAYYAAVLGMLGVGTVAALARREPRVLTRDAMPLGNRIGLALSGIEIDIVCGREHLTQSRPCVFVFNHQSKLDAPILLGLLGGDLAGVGKAEIAKVPGVGQFLASAGVVFAERKNSAKAQAAVAPLVAKLRDERVSLCFPRRGPASRRRGWVHSRPAPSTWRCRRGFPSSRSSSAMRRNCNGGAGS